LLNINTCGKKLCKDSLVSITLPLSGFARFVERKYFLTRYKIIKNKGSRIESFYSAFVPLYAITPAQANPSKSSPWWSPCLTAPSRQASIGAKMFNCIFS
jgi:hypothetical protein